MLLSISDRIHLLNLLPDRGNVLALRVMGEAKQRVAFTGQELKDWKIEHDPATDTINWEKAGGQEKEIDLGEAAVGMVVEQLKKLDATASLQVHHLPLWEKFVECKTPGITD